MANIHPWVFGLAAKPEHLQEVRTLPTLEKVYPAHRYGTEVDPDPAWNYDHPDAVTIFQYYLAFELGFGSNWTDDHYIYTIGDTRWAMIATDSSENFRWFGTKQKFENGHWNEVWTTSGGGTSLEKCKEFLKKDIKMHR